MTDSSKGAWCYRQLLRAYPARYRARFAGDMLDTFMYDHARVTRRGWLSLAAFWVVTIVQAVWFGSRERRSRQSASGVPEPPRQFRFSLWPDIRHAFRLLMRSPLFAVTSILSLALGLAATTVIFTLTDALIMQPSPGIRDAGTLVDIGRSSNGSGYDNMSYPIFKYLRDHTQTLDGMSATLFSTAPLSLAEGGRTERIFSQMVSASYFDVVQVRPAAGRFFRPDEDDVPDNAFAVVLTHRFWTERLGADPAIVGQTLRLNNRDFTVVGVAEPDFEGTTMIGTDVWVPMGAVATVRGEARSTLLTVPNASWHTAIGRRRPGFSNEQVRAELQTLLETYRADTPAVPEYFGMAVASTGRLPPAIRLPFGVFFGVLFLLTGGLLAIACSNVAGMLLARATTRHREIATRLAIGASRRQLLAQLMTETLVLFAASAAVALPIAMWLAGILQASLPALPEPILIDLTVGGRAMAFALGLSLLAGLAFGLAPARQALRADLSSALHGHASTASRRRFRTRHALVVAQVALSLTLVVTAGLFVRTLVAAANISPGYRIANVDVVSLDTTLAGVEGRNGVRLIDRVVDEIRTVSGVTAVGHSRMIPLQGGGMGLGGVRVPGLPDDALERLNDADWDVVSPTYFDTLEIPVVDGRAFEPADRDGRPLVAVVNQTFARIAWPGQSAVGQRFWQVERRDDPGRPIEVVGVVGDAKYRSISEAQQPFIYVPFAQQPQNEVSLYIAYGTAPDLGRAVRDAIARVDTGLPVIQYQSFADATSLGLLPQRIAAWVAGIVGGMGLFLAALGLYGLTAFLVAQRSREIAIRMAMGATIGQVQGMVLYQAGRLAIVGGAIGLVLAAGMGTVMQRLSLLVDVRSTDPVTFVGVAVLMAAIMLIASLLPARRAAQTDPANALRAE